jgi:hypothetical protein
MRYYLAIRERARVSFQRDYLLTVSLSAQRCYTVNVQIL